MHKYSKNYIYEMHCLSSNPFKALHLHTLRYDFILYHMKWAYNFFFVNKRQHFKFSSDMHPEELQNISSFCVMCLDT